MKKKIDVVILVPWMIKFNFFVWTRSLSQKKWLKNKIFRTISHSFRYLIYFHPNFFVCVCVSLKKKYFLTINWYLVKSCHVVWWRKSGRRIRGLIVRKKFLVLLPRVMLLWCNNMSRISHSGNNNNNKWRQHLLWVRKSWLRRKKRLMLLEILIRQRRRRQMHKIVKMWHNQLVGDPRVQQLVQQHQVRHHIRQKRHVDQRFCIMVSHNFFFIYFINIPNKRKKQKFIQ